MDANIRLMEHELEAQRINAEEEIPQKIEEEIKIKECVNPERLVIQ